MYLSLYTIANLSKHDNIKIEILQIPGGFDIFIYCSIIFYYTIDTWQRQEYKYIAFEEIQLFLAVVSYILRTLWTTPFIWQWLTLSRICWMQCEASASE